MDLKISPVVMREMVEELAHRVTHEPLETRHAVGKLTGEWIIFAMRDGKNYYLAINGHQTDDQTIYDRIVQHTKKTFLRLRDGLRRRHKIQLGHDRSFYLGLESKLRTRHDAV